MRSNMNKMRFCFALAAVLITGVTFRVLNVCAMRCAHFGASGLFQIMNAKA